MSLSLSILSSLSIEAVFYRVNQYLQLYGAVEGAASLVQDCIDQLKVSIFTNS